jgi:hypothetical protein
MVFFIQEMIRNQEYFNMDPIYEYHNPRHDKVYGKYKLECVTDYYKNNKISYNTEAVVIPWDVRMTQEINCVNV